MNSTEKTNPVDITVSKTSLRARWMERSTAVSFSGVADIDGAIVTLWSEIVTWSPLQVRIGSERLGVVALDVESHPVFEILWADDQRSADDAAWCNKKFPTEWWLARIGDTPQSHHGITKLSWLHRSDPDAWSKISSICGIDDYVRWRSLEESQRGEASADLVITEETFSNMGWGLGLRTDPEVLNLLDRDRNWADVVPAVVPEGTILGSHGGIEITI